MYILISKPYMRHTFARAFVVLHRSHPFVRRSAKLHVANFLAYLNRLLSSFFASRSAENVMLWLVIEILCSEGFGYSLSAAVSIALFSPLFAARPCGLCSGA
jgi:hypothetical protein